MSTKKNIGIASLQPRSRQPELAGRGHVVFQRFRQYFDSKKNHANWLLPLGVGFVFGVSVSYGLGLNLQTCLVFGVLTGTGILLSKSLIAYLVLQTIVLSLVAAVSQLIFRLNDDFAIVPLIFQLAYLALVILTPLLFLAPKIKRASKSLKANSSVELFAVFSFSAAVLFLRSRMPSDGSYALGKLYFGEDNAAIISNTTKSIESGFASQFLFLGEFVNGIYLTTAGLIGSLGEVDSTVLLPVLTHYNLILLFMAWVPLTALSALVLSGLKLGTPASLVLIATTSAALGLLFWPFVSIGHTSVIVSGLIAASLLALTFNKQLALEHPIFFLVAVTSLGFLVGTTWFPLMPFAGATIALTFLHLAQREYRKGNRLFAIAFISALVALGLAFLPNLVNLVQNNSGYLAMLGGTRKPSYALVIIWAALVLLVLWAVFRAFKHKEFLGSTLFVTVLVTLVASNVFLLLGGLAANAGSFGYGATKYLMTSISFSLPVLWLILVGPKFASRPKEIAGISLILILVILLVQPDSRKVPATILLPNLTSWDFLAPPGDLGTKLPNHEIVRALESALDRKPKHLFCVSDYGFPVDGAEMSLDSYFCTRWGQSLTANEQGFIWRLVPLGAAPKDDLVAFTSEVGSEKVVVLRFTNPPGVDSPAIERSKTWWNEYVNNSWEIITVR
jgi:hypothetical protein